MDGVDELLLIDRLVKKVHRSELSCHRLSGELLLAADNNHGNLLGLARSAESLEHLNSSSAGHIDIGKYEIGGRAQRYHECLQRIHGEDYFEFLGNKMEANICR